MAKRYHVCYPVVVVVVVVAVAVVVAVVVVVVILLHIVTINNYFYIIPLDFLSSFDYIIDCVLRYFVCLLAFGFVPLW